MLLLKYTPSGISRNIAHYKLNQSAYVVFPLPVGPIMALRPVVMVPLQINSQYKDKHSKCSQDDLFQLCH